VPKVTIRLPITFPLLSVVFIFPPDETINQIHLIKDSRNGGSHHEE
jgi:hypothetical protein